MHDKIYNKVHNIFHNEALFTTWLIASYTTAPRESGRIVKNRAGRTRPVITDM